MKRLIYQVAVGECPDFYWDCIRSVERFAERCGSEHTVQTEPALRVTPRDSKRSKNALRLGYLPIFEKANAFAELETYDQVLILDADVYVKGSAPNIFEEADTAFAGVPERDLPMTVQHADKVRKYSKGQYERLNDVDWQWDDRGAHFYNMGVMLLSQQIVPYLRYQSPAEFLERDEFQRFINGEGHWKWSTDQTLLNWWVKKSKMPTTDLSWKWNALYSACTDVSKAHFIHFFLSSKMPQGGKEIPVITEGLGR